MPVEYKAADVLEAARERVAMVFDRFERVVVSVSAGKDSTVLRHLAIEEAVRRERKVELFFLDQEAEYASTIAIVREWMRDPRITPRWFQVPIYMTNATSYRDYWLYAWGDGESWMRDKDPIAIHALDDDYPKRFYDFFEWYERTTREPTAFLVGLRSAESFNRFRAVTKRPGYDGIPWSTKTASPHAYRFYPIYDWQFGDVWKCIVDEGLAYNAHYDRLFAKYGTNAAKMRVSNLIHEKAFRCLVDLQEFEPDTYERLIRRLGGVHAAALYGAEGQVFDARELPSSFASWRAYRDHLLATTPCDRIERFRKRFARQANDEETARQQVKQLLLNDWEGSVPVQRAKADKLRSRWWNEL